MGWQNFRNIKNSIDNIIKTRYALSAKKMRFDIGKENENGGNERYRNDRFTV